MNKDFPQKIAVIGTGANGSSIGADLTKAGLDVTLIDQWPAHVEAMKENGLDITMPNEHLKTPVNAWHLCELAEHVPAFDIVFLTSKSYDTHWLAQLIEPYLKDNGIFIGLQNGMNNEIISSVVGQERTLGAVVELSSALFTPGIIQRNTTRAGTWFGLGELDGSVTPRLELVKSIIENVAAVSLCENLESAKWTKLITNAMTMGPISLTGLKNHDARDLPGMFEIAVQLGREARAVGKALGYEMQPIFGLSAEELAGESDEPLIKVMQTLSKHVGPNSVTAAIHDHIKGRKTETENINGLVAQKGKELGIQVIHNAAVTELDHRITKREIAMDESNLGLLKSMIDSIPNRI
jgi:2-dehydropantoate 2-reductase